VNPKADREAGVEIVSTFSHLMSSKSKLHKSFSSPEAVSPPNIKSFSGLEVVNPPQPERLAD
jgi:hypothetical protein